MERAGAGKRGNISRNGKFASAPVKAIELREHPPHTSRLAVSEPAYSPCMCLTNSEKFRTGRSHLPTQILKKATLSFLSSSIFPEKNNSHPYFLSRVMQGVSSGLDLSPLLLRFLTARLGRAGLNSSDPDVATNYLTDRWAFLLSPFPQSIQTHTHERTHIHILSVCVCFAPLGEGTYAARQSIGQW
jgi:hypothetical protein